MVCRPKSGPQCANDMPNNLKIRSPWSQLALFLALLGASLIILILVAGVIYNAAGYTGSHIDTTMSDPRMIATLKWIQALSTVIVFGIPAYFYARATFTNRPLYHLGLRPAVKSSFYLLAIILLLISFPLAEQAVPPANLDGSNGKRQ